MKLLKFYFSLLFIATIAACSSDDDDSDDVPFPSASPIEWECSEAYSYNEASSIYKFQVPASGGVYILKCKNKRPGIANIKTSLDSTFSDYHLYTTFYKVTDEDEEKELVKRQLEAGALYPANNKDDICKWLTVEVKNEQKEHTIVVDENNGPTRFFNFTFENGDLFSHVEFIQEGK